MRKIQTFLSPLKLARGSGSAKSGTRHWINQRISAIALMVLGLWVLSLLLQIASCDAVIVQQAYASFYYTAVTSLFLLVGFYHSWLGLQTVIEDYVHTPFLKYFLLIVAKFSCVSGAFVGIFSLLKLVIR